MSYLHKLVILIYLLNDQNYLNHYELKCYLGLLNLKDNIDLILNNLLIIYALIWVLNLLVRFNLNLNEKMFKY